jgi:hypothetical protein
MRGAWHRATGLLLAAGLAFTSNAHANWPASPHVDVLACGPPGFQVSVVSTTDGAGGVYIAWTDTRSDMGDIYAIRVGADGAPAPGWPVTGKPIATGPDFQWNPAICEDGAGGAFIAWNVYSSATKADIRVLRIDGSGSPRSGWTVAGLLIANNVREEINPRIEPDGAGGAFVAWEQIISSTNHDIRAVRVFGSATTSSQLAVCTQTSKQQNIVLESDGDGGLFLVWEDDRNAPLLAGWDIYAAHINSVGGLDWPSNGVGVTTYFADQLGPSIAADGAGGLFVFWQDARNAKDEIFGRRMGPTGTPLWPETLISTAPSTEFYPRAVSDGVGGVYVAWTRNITAGNRDIYAQRLRPNGAIMWTANGVALCTQTNSQNLVALVSDGENGMLAVWTDDRDGVDDDLYAQRVGPASASGLWALNGVQISSSNAVYAYVGITADGRGGFISAWSGYRTGDAENDIYAKRFDAFGFVGNLAPSVVSVADVPNDQGGQVKVSWDASDLDTGPYFDVSEYRMWRSVPPQAALAALRAGAARLVADEGTRDGSETGLRRLLREMQAGVTTYWEHTGTQIATGNSGYSMVVATESDSIDGSNPLTQFRVQALHDGGWAFWNSEPASGYSVDNLAPPAPSPFTATYLGGSTALHWGIVSVADLRGYRIYAGPDAGFTPGPGSFLTEVPDTGYVHATPSTLHYKLTAVDAHGNESPAGLVSPPPNVAAGPTVRRALAFAPPGPNPSTGDVELRWTLPAETHVRLAIFDAAGRRVDVIADRVYAAGEHRVSWSGALAGGRTAEPGLYFARLEAAGRTLIRRVARIR